MKYEIYETQMKDMYIKKTDDNGLETYIPCDPANSEYQAYLASLDEASTL